MIDGAHLLERVWSDILSHGDPPSSTRLMRGYREARAFRFLLDSSVDPYGLAHLARPS